MIRQKNFNRDVFISVLLNYFDINNLYINDESSWRGIFPKACTWKSIFPNKWRSTLLSGGAVVVEGVVVVGSMVVVVGGEGGGGDARDIPLKNPTTLLFRINI